jgi:RAD50-interacting protein 1
MKRCVLSMSHSQKPSILKFKLNCLCQFFIQLWDELQERARATSVEDNLAGSMTYTEVKDVTSGAVGSEEEGSLFDVTIDNYERIRNKAESLIEQAIKYSFPTIFKQYLTKPQWTTIGDVPSSGKQLQSSFFECPLTREKAQISLSQLSSTYHFKFVLPRILLTLSLLIVFQTLGQYLAFLHKAIAFSSFKRIWRRCFETLQDLLFNDILLKQDFTTLGAARLMQDLAAIQNVVNLYVSYGVDSKLMEGIALLNLPLEAKEGQVTLKEASQEMFTTNAQAEALLQRLGMTRLSNYEARSVLQRRVEAND